MASPLYEIPEQTSPDEIDEEILEIFIEEMDEVKQEVVDSFNQWRKNPGDKESLQTLRRAFHTMKGSGRLVGAAVIGELGWAFENMLNRVIDGNLPRNNDLIKLIEQVEPLVPELIEQFQQGRQPRYQVRLVISQAHHLTETKGKSLGEFEAGPAEEETVATPPGRPEKPETETPREPAPTEIAGQAEQEEADEEFAGTGEMEFGEDDIEELAETSDADFEMEMELEGGDEDFGELEGDLEAFSEELGEFGGDLEGGELPDLDEFPELESGDEDLETTSGEPEPEPVETPSRDEDEAEEAGEEVDPALLAIFRNEAAGHLNVLKAFLVKCRKHPPCKVSDELLRSLHTLNGSSRSVEFGAVAALVAPMEGYMRVRQEHDQPLSREVMTLFVETGKMLEGLLSGNGKVRDPQAHDKVVNQWREWFRGVSPEEEARATSAEREISGAGEDQASGEKPQKTAPGEKKSSVEVAEAAPEAADEFMEIFLDESEEILETSQSLIAKWQASPNSMPLIKELQRELHTLKGGARMVGISAMGDLSHQLESVLTRIAEGNAQSNPQLQAIVQESLDELAAMLEAVRSGVPLEPATDLIEQINSALKPPGEGEEPPPPSKQPRPRKTPKAEAEQLEAEAEEKTEAEAKGEKESQAGGQAEAAGVDAEERIRVRAALIDKLTNLAGELSISRAHMEQQQGSLKSNLVEMEQTVLRLRDLLRRLDIETEVQIMAHFRQQEQQMAAQAAEEDEDFDPLEMDRFSVMQQLSRSLMETVSDLMNIQDQMRNLLRHSDSLLVQQSRIGGELQDGIMRTRMVPFSQIAPRLQRIARLTARELHKQVSFSINDESIEFERTVLNRIVAPLEHMLRNAIGHGVELPEDRQKIGKPQTANIAIELFREGSELILRLGDDGAGLNYEAIRRKAEERGLVKPGAKVTEQELCRFILEPAFSTAKSITQVSGRGVGMDIANSEIKQLGGTLQIFSKRGEGTTFEIRLPLSLSINKALLVHLGEETMAVPLPNVDAVLRVPRQDVLIGSNEEVRYFRYMDHDYRIFHLGEMLGFGRAPVDTALLPLLLVRSADQRLALLVDGVEGNREVVVKSVGPQLSSIRWIAGATILGDGRVVLILDVLTLMRTNVTALKPVETEEPVADAGIKTVMVVDDSITVRKVTARLLKRQGLDVMTAKDGVDAVSQLQEHIPDIMLLDVEMPRMDGFELATQVRNDDRWKNIPIIMITSRTGVKHRERASRIGINRHLGKPFNETELLENINQLLTEKS